MIRKAYVNPEPNAGLAWELDFKGLNYDERRKDNRGDDRRRRDSGSQKRDRRG